MSLSKVNVSVDSFQFFLNDCLPKLRKIEEMFSIIGIFFVGKFLLSTLFHIVRGIRTHFVSRLFTKNFTSKYGNWAVVTGCTAGIGKAYAEELAKQGMDIVLISRNENKLRHAALELRTKYDIKTEIIQADFLEGRTVYEKIEENLKNKDIGILVNNVGIILDKPKIFHKSRDDEIWGHINVNMATIPVLMKIVLPSMIRRKKGAIINIASLSGIHPIPYLGIYGASKAFVEHLSDACAEEYTNHGITIQTLTPSYILTNMLNYSGIFKKSSFLFPPPQKYVSNAIHTLGYSNLTTGYWPHGVQKWFMEQLLPRYIFIKFTKLLHMIISPGKIGVD